MPLSTIFSDIDDVLQPTYDVAQSMQDLLLIIPAAGGVYNNLDGTTVRPFVIQGVNMDGNTNAFALTTGQSVTFEFQVDRPMWVSLLQFGADILNTGAAAGALDITWNIAIPGQPTIPIFSIVGILYNPAFQRYQHLTLPFQKLLSQGTKIQMTFTNSGAGGTITMQNAQNNIRNFMRVRFQPHFTAADQIFGSQRIQ